MGAGRRGALAAGALALLALRAGLARVFSVVKYESMIHEFDPYFNFRATKHITGARPAPPRPPPRAPGAAGRPLGRLRRRPGGSGFPRLGAPPGPPPPPRGFPAGP